MPQLSDFLGGGCMTILYPEVIADIDRIGHADIVVGIPSFRNAQTIAHVMRTVGVGLAEYFPDMTAVVVNADGGSEDDTREAAMAAPLPAGVARIVTPYQGLPGKGSAFHTIFEVADRLEAMACLVFDADLRSIAPEWVVHLARPIIEQSYGFVTPSYLRYKYDGTITNLIAYPLVRALLGRRIRQPIGGEFGMSGALAKIYGHKNVWDTEIARFGIDIFMTVTAVASGFRIAQSALGVKLHDPKDPSADLAGMFNDVTYTLFELLCQLEFTWSGRTESIPVTTFGEPRLLEPTGPDMDIEDMAAVFVARYAEHRETAADFLTPHNLAVFDKAASNAPHDIIIREEVWAHTVYDAIAAFGFASTRREIIVEALYPLYLARTVSFINETRLLSSFVAEAIVERGADVFELERPHLVSRWRRNRAQRARDADAPTRFA